MAVGHNLRRKNLRLSLNGTLGLTGNLTIVPKTIEPEPEPAVSDDFLRLKDDYLDGPTGEYANYTFRLKWLHGNLGDWLDADEVAQGGNQYANLNINVAVPVDPPYPIVSCDITALAQAWVTLGNTGLHMRQAAGGANNVYFGSRVETWGPKPRVEITTAEGTFQCPCLAIISIASTSAPQDPAFGGDVVQATTPVMLRFDLQGVTGTVLSATFYITCVYGGAANFLLNRLDMPVIYDDPAVQIGGVVQGIANTVATRDQDLANHPSVIQYADISSDDNVDAAYEVVSGPLVGAGVWSYHTWDDLGINFIRAPFCYVPETGCQRSLSWWMRFQPDDMPYTYGLELGFNDLYARCLMVLGTDIRTGNSDFGFKMPGFEGIYNHGGTSPAPDGLWSLRLWHSPPSPEHPDLYMLRIYALDYEAFLAPANASWHMNLYRTIFLRAGRRYVIEYRLKMNTIVGGVPQQDGIIQVWIDGVLIHSETNRRIRQHISAQIQTRYVNTYHGGLQEPIGPMHHDFGGDVVATEYIGPPKSFEPAYVPALGRFAEFTLNTARESGAAGRDSTFANWCGGSYLTDFSSMGGVGYQGGGEHYSVPDDGGCCALNLETRLYESCCVSDPSNLQVAFDVGSPTDQWGAYLADGSPQSKHTYDGMQEMPSAWGGGPRGSLIRVGHSGGSVLPPTSGPWYNPNGGSSPGYTATWRYDLNYSVGGKSRLSGPNLYDYGSGDGSAVNDAPLSGMDWTRQGWWSKCRYGGGWGDRLIFTHKTGTVTSFPTPTHANDWGQIHHFADEDLLVLLSGANYFPWGSGVAICYAPTSLVVDNPPWVTVQFAGHSAANEGEFLMLSSMGMRWCDHPNIQAFVGMDYFYQPDPFNVYIMFLTPPPVGQRFTQPWVWSREIVSSGDGSQITPRLDPSSSNGIFGKLVYAPKLKSLVWTRAPYEKGQLIRTAAMT